LRLARLRHAVAGGKRRRDGRRGRKTAAAGSYQVQRAADPQQIAGREPLLRSGLAGGLWVPGDGIVYAPNVARWLVADAGDHLTCLRDSAQAITEPQVQLASGKRLQARAIVVACGLEANALLAENWLRPKKGQLAITDRYGPRVHHQLVELGYGASAHGGGTSVAFNLQPRPTGQLLIGSSRQFDNRERQLDLPCWADARSRPPFCAGAGDAEYHPLLERPARRLTGWQSADWPASHAPRCMAGAGP
jgi:L-2-hydroxyglutarate oxidase LhgO